MEVEIVGFGGEGQVHDSHMTQSNTNSNTVFTVQ